MFLDVFLDSLWVRTFTKFAAKVGPKGGAFGVIFITFGGQGTFSWEAVSWGRNLSRAGHKGVQMVPWARFFQGLFLRRVPGPSFSKNVEFWASLGPLEQLFEHFGVFLGCLIFDHFLTDFGGGSAAEADPL